MNVYTPASTKIVHNTRADMTNRLFVPQPVHLVQYDKRLPILAVRMYRDGQLYTIPDSAKVNIRLGKKDRTFVYNPALGVDSTKTIVYFEISLQMVTLFGEVNPVVEIDIADQIAASSPIPILIDRNPVQEDMIESSIEYITAKEYAEKAVEAANKAKTSETNAKASETAAKASETKAKTSETNAKASENAAKTSETKAKTSETNAKASESVAKVSEAKAKTSETNAKASENAAKASEMNAKTSEMNAKASETAAKISEEIAKEVEKPSKAY